MIDIHPPQHAPMTRREFFTHLFIVVLGILIAIGLEQTVELIHEHHQRIELREGVITDARLYLRDVDENRDADTRQVEDLTARIQQVRETISFDHPLAPPAYRPAFPIETIRLGNLAAAKSSGLIHLLSEDEINSFAEAEVAVIKSEALKEHAQEAATKRVAFEQRFQTGFPSGSFDFSHIAPAQLDEYLGLLIEERVRRTETLAYLELMHRSALAYLDGQRDLEKLRAAEQNASAH